MRFIVMAAAALAGISAHAAPYAGPVIDMHLHASRVPGHPVPICPGSEPMAFVGVDPKAPADPDNLIVCEHPILSPATKQLLMQHSLAAMTEHNVRRAVIAGPPAEVEAWVAAAPGRLIPATDFAAPKGGSVEELRQLHAAGKFAVFAELSIQYQGLEPGDPRFVPYWALAEELDIPVGIHMGEGMPGVHLLGPDPYRVRLGSPLLLDDVLARHPKLRVYVMHYGSPFVDEMIGMLFSHPNLYVDVAANDWNLPRAEFHAQLRRLVDAGFSRRILFGSDQTIWPEGIGLAIEGVDSAPFLTDAQKRDIFYDNAARFLRLSPEDVARDHRPQ